MDGSGDGGGATAVAKTVSSTMATVMESVKEMTGFDLTETMRAHTYDAKVNKNVNLNSTPLVAVTQEDTSNATVTSEE